jgi:hypothetical protein
VKLFSCPSSCGLEENVPANKVSIQLRIIPDYSLDMRECIGQDLHIPSIYRLYEIGPEEGLVQDWQRLPPNGSRNAVEIRSRPERMISYQMLRDDNE